MENNCGLSQTASSNLSCLQEPSRTLEEVVIPTSFQEPKWTRAQQKEKQI